MRITALHPLIFNAPRHTAGRGRCFSEKPPALRFLPADAIRLFQSEGLSLPFETAQTIARLVQATAQPQEICITVAPFEIHCRNSGLPSFISLTKVILIYGLRALQQKDPHQRIDLETAAENYFSFADRKTARHQLNEILRKTGVRVSPDHTHLIFEEDDREQGFLIRGPDHTNLDGFALANRFLFELYKHFKCDIKRVSDFFGKEPLQKIRYHLRKAGAQTHASKEIAAFCLPRCLTALLTSDTATDIRARLIQIMADLDAMARHVGFADRSWLDDALTRLTHDIVTDIFSLAPMQNIPHETKGIVISEAWHHLQNLMRKRVQMKEFLPGLSFEFRLTRALEKRLSLFPGNTLVFESKDFLPFANKPWAHAYLVPESFESIFLQIPSLGLFGGEAFFTEDELHLFAAKNTSLDVLRDGALRLFDRLKTLNFHFDPDIFRHTWSERFDHDPEASQRSLEGEIADTLNKFNFIKNAHRLIIFGICNQERQPLVQRIGQIARELEQLKLSTQHYDDRVAHFSRIIQNISDLITYFRNIAHLSHAWYRNHNRALHLYRRLYGVRTQLGAFTMLGPLPQSIQTSQVIFASLFVPNLSPDLLAKMPREEHAFLVIDGPRTTHMYHQQMAFRNFFLQGFQTIETRFASATENERRAFAARYHDQAKHLRLYIMSDGKNPIGVILNAESAETGGQQQTSQGLMADIAKQAFRDSGIAESHIVFLNSTEENDANHRKMELEQLRHLVLARIKDGTN